MMSKRSAGGWAGREGGTADNIGSELGSISPYPTYIAPGQKSYFANILFMDR